MNALIVLICALYSFSAFADKRIRCIETVPGTGAVARGWLKSVTYWQFFVIEEDGRERHYGSLFGKLEDSGTPGARKVRFYTAKGNVWSYSLILSEAELKLAMAAEADVSLNAQSVYERFLPFQEREEGSYACKVSNL